MHTSFSLNFMQLLHFWMIKQCNKMRNPGFSFLSSRMGVNWIVVNWIVNFTF